MGNNQKGQTILEVVVAAVVGILVVAALVFATIFSLRNANFAKNSAQATALAQEGLEKVRTIRDQETIIIGFLLNHVPIYKWSDAYWWDNKIDGNCGDITVVPPRFCYFRIIPVAGVSSLQWRVDSSSFPSDSNVEQIGQFKRVIILSDESTPLPDGTPAYKVQKNVSAVVRWADATGPHEVKLNTILRKL